MQDKAGLTTHPAEALPEINAVPGYNSARDNVQPSLPENDAEHGDWHFVNEGRRRQIPIKPTKNNIPTENKFQSLSINGSNSDDCVGPENITAVLNISNIEPQSTHVVPAIQRRPQVIVSKYPERNILQNTHPKHVPGNSSYSGILKEGSKTLILCDSICSRIKMKRFNTFLRNSTAYRKNFPGTTPKELKHYCIYNLIEDCPDNTIISVGTNSLHKDSPQEIANDIFDIVDICHQYGVGKIFIPTITCRKNFQKEIDELNNLLRSNESFYDFKVIDNGNITNSHIWKDNIHLTDDGLGILANNLIDALNGNNTR